MQATRVEGWWLGQPAVTLETSHLRVTTVPAMGAKLVSVFDKEARREWLLPPINRPFQPVVYGANFIEQDMSGWDEMFPTIVTCAYPLPGRYAGAPLPDHGEVWALPWEPFMDVDTPAVGMSLTGQALPYRLARTICPLNARAVRLEYEALNTGDEEIIGLWTAHPQFKVDADTRIVLPPGVESVIMVYETGRDSRADTVYPVHTAFPDRGEKAALDRVNVPGSGNCRKYYLPPQQPVRWVALRQGLNGDWIRLSWNPDPVAYLGVWIDEGGINPASTIALEPSTGFYDDLSRAWENRRVLRLMPGIPYRWHLDVECGTGEL